MHVRGYPRPFLSLGTTCALLAGLLSTASALAVNDLYWDTNGATAGTGSPAGTWVGRCDL